jgi:hypothetical protein
MFSGEEPGNLSADGEAITEKQIESLIFHGKGRKKKGIILYSFFNSHELVFLIHNSTTQSVLKSKKNSVTINNKTEISPNEKFRILSDKG